jgi:hypothetical protein
MSATKNINAAKIAGVPDDVLAKTITATGTVIDYTTSKEFNSSLTPATGNITNDLTGAVLGTIQTLYHNDSSEPTIPANWVKLGGSYKVDELNIFYIKYVTNDRIEYWINNTGNLVEIIPSTTVSLPLGTIVSSGGGTVVFVLLNNELTYRITGSGTRTIYLAMTIPEDYKSDGQIVIEARKSATGPTITVSGWIDGTLDGTVNGADVTPPTNNSYNIASSNFSSDLSGSKGMYLQIAFTITLPSTQVVHIKNIHFKYNK